MNKLGGRSSQFITSSSPLFPSNKHISYWLSPLEAVPVTFSYFSPAPVVRIRDLGNTKKRFLSFDNDGSGNVPTAQWDVLAPYRWDGGIVYGEIFFTYFFGGAYPPFVAGNFGWELCLVCFNGFEVPVVHESNWWNTPSLNWSIPALNTASGLVYKTDIQGKVPDDPEGGGRSGRCKILAQIWRDASPNIRTEDVTGIRLTFSLT